MGHSFKHHCGATVEVDDNGKKRIFFEDIEFESISAVNKYINSSERRVEKRAEDNAKSYYRQSYIKRRGD